ncbi:MAG: RecQ family ATP-dependent DNA helicase [Prevotella sp.]|nr:RecQ family ATP-dependent DNA helicase [Prevotella sp.]
MVDQFQAILKEYWGYDDFRGIQREIIESISNGTDTLGLMPTGGGKSITFQVPALAKDGVCIVITPLIALMKDQVQNLRRHGVRVAAIYTGLTRAEIIQTLENCIFGGVKLLYISPERISSELFQTKLRHMQVSFITVDEAHCISQWGYDFRPSYLHINDLRKIKPDAPVLALTATATPRVINDIQEKLSQNYAPDNGSKLKEEKPKFNVFRMSYERKNLAYRVHYSSDKYTDLVQLLNRTPGSAIVYARSRRRTKEIADILNEHNINATHFHAGLDHATKDQRQKDWQADRIRVMVATNAFGMGIDKPDVRLVAHIDCPDSLEAYFQEAGRAGRDGKHAEAVLLYNNSDAQKLTRRINDTWPEKEYIREIYNHLAYFYQIGIGSGYGHTFEFDIDKFCHNFKHFPVQVHSALNILTRTGYIDYAEENDNSARIHFLIDRNELYRLDSLTEIENDLIVVLLRNYGGVFTDYVFVDEAFLAQQIGLTLQQTYFVFTALNKRRILHFIPRKKTPFITYTKPRDDGERLIISHAVYEERKQQYTERINAIIGYAQNDEECRSRQLLRYFGEKSSHDCGQCDVCESMGPDYLCEDRLAFAKSKILELLSDGKKHNITELLSLEVKSDELDAALSYLVAEEMVILRGSWIEAKS